MSGEELFVWIAVTIVVAAVVLFSGYPGLALVVVLASAVGLIGYLLWLAVTAFVSLLVALVVGWWWLLLIGLVVVVIGWIVVSIVWIGVDVDDEFDDDDPYDGEFGTSSPPPLDDMRGYEPRDLAREEEERREFLRAEALEEREQRGREADALRGQRRRGRSTVGEPTEGLPAWFEDLVERRALQPGGIYAYCLVDEDTGRVTYIGQSGWLGKRRRKHREMGRRGRLKVLAGPMTREGAKAEERRLLSLYRQEFGENPEHNVTDSGDWEPNPPWR